MRWIWLLLPLPIHAQWLCREASSTRSGHTITSCGVGHHSSLEQARINARESALEEFQRLCQLSQDCTDHAYIVEPLRTECESAGDSYVCYRAMAFSITTQKKRSMAQSYLDLSSELDEKDQEVQMLEFKMNKIQQIKKTEQDRVIKEQELKDLQGTLNVTEKKVVEKDLERPNSYQNRLQFSTSVWASKLTSKNETDFMWHVAYERKLSSWLGLQPSIGFGRGDGKVSFADLGIATLVYPWSGLYVLGELGRVGGYREISEKERRAFTSDYSGVHLGFDTRRDHRRWGASFQLGIRKSQPMGTVGVNFGF